MNIVGIAFGTNYDSATMPIISMYGDHDLSEQITVNVRSDEEGDLNKAAWENPPSIHMASEKGSTRLHTHRYSWVEDRPVTHINNLDLEWSGSPAGNWNEQEFLYRGWPVFKLDHTTTSGWLEAGFRLREYPDLKQKQCVAEVWHWPLADEFNSLSFDVGLQLRCQSADGEILTQSTVGAKGDYKTTTGTMAALSTFLTVADGTKLNVGDPVAVVGAGPGGTPLVSHVVSKTSATVATLAHASSVAVTDNVCWMPQLRATRCVFRPGTNEAEELVAFRLITTDTDGGAYIAKVVVREVGSPEAYIPYLEQTARQTRMSDLGTINGSQSIDFGFPYGNSRVMELDGNLTISSLFAPQAGTTYRLIARSDSVTTRTITYPSSVKGSPVTSIDNQTGIVIPLFYDGTDFHAQ